MEYTQTTFTDEIIELLTGADFTPFGEQDYNSYPGAARNSFLLHHDQGDWIANPADGKLNLSFNAEMNTADWENVAALEMLRHDRVYTFGGLVQSQGIKSAARQYNGKLALY